MTHGIWANVRMGLTTLALQGEEAGATLAYLVTSWYSARGDYTIKFFFDLGRFYSGVYPLAVQEGKIPMWDSNTGTISSFKY